MDRDASGRIPVGYGRRDFLKMMGWSVILAPAATRMLASCAADEGATVSPWTEGTRIGCLYNGYILTVNPERALASDTTDDRYRLYVVHAVLIHPNTGRVAAVYPPLVDAGDGTPLARPVGEYGDLATHEQPPAPGVTLDEILSYWRGAGVPEELLTGANALDIDGAVVTPGIVDDHFHVSSWSKKLPGGGERFGFYADVGEPRYYLRADGSRECAETVLWRIVADVNGHLVEQDRDRICLHGYWYTDVSSGADGEAEAAWVFRRGSDPAAAADPDYLLNRVGNPPGGSTPAPAGSCPADPAAWPGIDYPVAPALLVHTSGQSCWYNAALVERFNDFQRELGQRFAETLVASVTPPTGATEPWQLQLVPGSGGVREQSPPFGVDVVVGAEPRLHIPFQVDEIAGNVLRGKPLIPELAADVLAAPSADLALVPFWRPVVTFVADADWASAAAYWGIQPDGGQRAYGAWDPARPHATNWYNGAERGLVQYGHDVEAGGWRPTGYAEHYVMRDVLSAVVIDKPTVAEAMQHRRNLARWCHRHGITGVQNIMFYRRRTNPDEFLANVALSYDHSLDPDSELLAHPDVDPNQETGGFGLRVGLYYYLENGDDVDEVLELDRSEDPDGDIQRMLAPPDHPEYPGWVRWVGWKLQLDGGTGARTLCTNSPMPKAARTDPYTTVDDAGRTVSFTNHSFGLLTMTNEQEQVFTSRESAALYWLVREGDPSSPHHNPAVRSAGTILARGVTEWLGESVDEEALAEDLRALEHVEWKPAEAGGDDQPRQMAAKISRLFTQIQSGFDRTFYALAKVWYEASRAPAGRIPRQVACHCAGDGAVDLWVRAIRLLKEDLAAFPDHYEALPERWKEVIPENADLSVVRRAFDNERFRVEHLLNVGAQGLTDIVGEGGIDAETTPDRRNVVFSTQPLQTVLWGEAIRTVGLPWRQDLWDLPSGGFDGLWAGLPAQPRCDHLIPCPLYIHHDVPFTLNTDPPALRDPRPALTVVGAVARTPLEVDATAWLDQTADEPSERPPDHLAGRVYEPLGLHTNSTTNPMRLSVEQSLAAMTYWAAYVVGLDGWMGALAPGGDGSPGTFADLVVWTHNPLAIRDAEGRALNDLAELSVGEDDSAHVATINDFLLKFRPAMTVVAGRPVYTESG